MGRKRSSDVIVSQILEACTEGAGKTRIVYSSNLNFTTIIPYLDMLVKGGLLEVVSGPRLKYQTTDRGLAVMSEFKHHHGEIFRLCALIEDSAAENV
jgi:predicted transcriptional regulator